LDGWTTPLGQSLYVFVIITSSKKEYIHSLINISKESHTGEFISQKIKEVLEDVGIKKFSAIVSDYAANMVAAKKKIVEKFPYIIPLRCIAHHINLLTSDIMKLEFAKTTIDKVCIFIYLLILLKKIFLNY
jgi:citrate lyase gamma subunit